MAGGPVLDGGRGEDPVRAPAPARPVPGGPGWGITPYPGGDPGKAARGFGTGGPLDQARPGAALAAALEQASGPGRPCPDATDDEVAGMLGRWEAVEAWCAAAKLGVIAELIRRRAEPGSGAAGPEGVPGGWQDGLVQEVSLALGISLRAADGLIDLAWTLAARLPLTRQALAAGIISLVKARIIADATAVLDDQAAAAAEALIAVRLPGKTPGQVAAMIARAVVTVDAEGAARRRERAQEHDARVALWREHAGTAALAGSGLPPAEALAANQHIQDRALAYQAAGVPGTLDQLRVRAFLDALNGTDARAGLADPGTGAAGPAEGGSQDRNGGSGPGGDARTGPAGSKTGDGEPRVAANIALTIPLATLLGLAGRPGDAHGLGALDPALARQMAGAAARHPRSTWCVTVTDEQGHAIGHGCAKPARKRKPSRASPQGGLGLTFTPAGDHGPPGDGYGTWQLSIAGQDYTVTLVTIPVTDCDHRYESAGYRPSALLRHLVQVRDGQCTQPTCARAARRCDFEHATPWDQGGRTCACNGGCRCRRDHRVKQSPGWALTQPRPGYHQWTTPSGRSYTSEPMPYPI